MTTEHPTDLLAALALDAIARKDERESVERHVAGCPRCRQEVDAMHFVAAALGNTVEQPPERVWSGISSRLYERGLRREMVPAGLGPLSASRHSHRARRPAYRRTLALVGTAAAVAIAFLTVTLVQSADRVNNLETALHHPTQAALAAALVTPGHRTVDLRSAAGADLGQFVLLPSGEGFLVRSEMPPAPAGKTYELWAIVSGTPIAVGLMGAAPTAVAFTVASAPRPSALAVTVEPKGGVTRPTTDPIGTAAV